MRRTTQSKKKIIITKKETQNKTEIQRRNEKEKK